MENHDQENLKALFERFMPSSEADAAAEEVRAGDAMLRAHPAPEPKPQTLAHIKLRIDTRLSHPPKASHPVYRLIGAAAAVVIVALIGLRGNRPLTPSNTVHAALIPTAIWESDDLAADDHDLAYFAAEVRQIEARVHALEFGEEEDFEASGLDEVEMELMRINSDFWKE